MVATTASAFGVAFGNNKGGSTDALERFFSGWESLFCAPRSVESLSKDRVDDPDVLDYVFESVESFTCADEASYDGKCKDPFSTPPRFRREQFHFQQQQPRGYSDDMSLRRENSLLEHGANGAPAMLTTQRGKQRTISRLGEQGDFLDYCFEHVESYVCSDGSLVDTDDYYGKSKGQPTLLQSTPTRNTHRGRNYSPEAAIPREISTPRTEKKKKKRRNRPKQNYYPDEEDTILLYYNPQAE